MCFVKRLTKKHKQKNGVNMKSKNVPGLLSRDQGEPPKLGHHWEELVVEGRAYQVRRKLTLALDAFNKAINTPNPGEWIAHSRRAECRLELQDYAGALQDTVTAMDRFKQDHAVDTPAPVATLTTAADALRHEGELEAALLLVERLCARRIHNKSMLSSPQKLRRASLKADIRLVLGVEARRVLRRDLVRAMQRRKGGVRDTSTTDTKRDSWISPDLNAAEDAAEEGDDPGSGWGFMKQHPEHVHICADRRVAEAARYVAELQALRLLQKDRAYLREFPGRLYHIHNMKERNEFRNSEERRDPLESSSMEAADYSNGAVQKIQSLVDAQLHLRPRYLHQRIGRCMSQGRRQQLLRERSDRTQNTVRFLVHRLHDNLASRQYRDVEHVGERLVAFLERVPCRVFADKYLALCRALDCRAVAARHSGHTAHAADMQKRRCNTALEHGLTEVFTRALDELALLLFHANEYQPALAAWTERAGLVEDVEETAQAIFQIARCHMVLGNLRKSGGPLRKSAKSAYRMSTMGTYDKCFETYDVYNYKKSLSLQADDSEDEEEEEEKKKKVKEESEPAEMVDPAHLKPLSVEACIRIVAHDLASRRPLHEYEYLVEMERYPDLEDAGRPYPLLPADFDEHDNLMNEKFPKFEQRFRETCQYFMDLINGGSDQRKPQWGVKSATAGSGKLREHPHLMTPSDVQTHGAVGRPEEEVPLSWDALLDDMEDSEEGEERNVLPDDADEGSSWLKGLDDDEEGEGAAQEGLVPEAEPALERMPKHH